MLNRNALMLVAGAAIFALDGSAMSAQARPRSTKRIPITKEAPGEVTTPRVDTVTIYRTDTLTTPGHVDTVMTTVTRVDTVIQTVNLTTKHIGGMYIGVAGGEALPFGAIRTVNQPGVLGQVQLGWQGLNTVLGLRGDVSLTQYAMAADYVILSDHRPLLWNGNLDAKLNLPVLTHTLGSAVIFTPYLIGGGSFVSFKDLRMKLNTDQGVGGGIGPQNAVIATSGGSGSIVGDNSFHTNWGWNAGGGLAFHAGRKEMFIEARGVRFVHGSNFENSWHVPVIFGVNLY